MATPGTATRPELLHRPSRPAADPVERREARPSLLRRERRAKRSLIAADVAAAIISMLGCALLSSQGSAQWGMALAIPVVVVANKLYGLYDRDELVIHKTTLEEAPSLFQLAVVLTLLAWLGDRWLFGADLTSGEALALWGMLWAACLLLRQAARLAVVRTLAPERLLLVGDAATYSRLAHKLEMAGVNAALVGRMSMGGATRASRQRRPTLREETLESLLAELDVDRVLIVPSHDDPQTALDVVRAVKSVGVRVSIVPDVMEVVGSAVVFDDLAGMTVLGVRRFGLSRSSRRAKRALDLVLGGALLLVAAPLMAMIALAIRLESRGPALVGSRRLGRRDRVLNMYAFRCVAGDGGGEEPLVTRVGGLLRRTSLSELPQLLNVLRGEMSLVGPRPLVPAGPAGAEGDGGAGAGAGAGGGADASTPLLHLTPGMTGYWQIMGSRRVPAPEMEKIDYLYVTNWSILEDLKILARSVLYLLVRRRV